MTSTEAASRPRVERSPADVLRLVVAVVVALALVLVEWLFGDTLVAFASELLRGLQAVPGWIVDVVVVGTRMLGVVFFVGGMAWAVVHRQWRMLATAAFAVVVAEALVALHLLSDVPPGETSIDVGVTVGPLGQQGFPTVWGIGAVVAALTASAPWLEPRLATRRDRSDRRDSRHRLPRLASLVRLARLRCRRMGGRRCRTGGDGRTVAPPDRRLRHGRPFPGRVAATATHDCGRRRAGLGAVLRRCRER